MRWPMALLLLLLPGCSGTAPEPAYQLRHWDSIPTQDGYTEVFQIDAALPVPILDLGVTVDGTPVNVTWHDDDGVLSKGDRFSFEYPEADAMRVLTIWQRSEQLVAFEFGSGAGTPVEGS